MNRMKCEKLLEVTNQICMCGRGTNSVYEQRSSTTPGNKFEPFGKMSHAKNTNEHKKNRKNDVDPEQLRAKKSFEHIILKFIQTHYGLILFMKEKLTRNTNFGS